MKSVFMMAAVAFVAAAEPDGFEMPAECFGIGNPVATSRAGDKRNSGQDTSNADQLLSAEWDPTFRVSRVQACSDKYNRVTGVQLNMVNPRGEKLTLDSMGNTSQDTSCTSIDLEEGQSITKIELAYKNDIRHMVWHDSDGRSFTVGRFYAGDTNYEWDFNDANRFVGLQGKMYQERLSKFGVLVYRPECGDKALYEFNEYGDVQDLIDGQGNASAMQRIKDAQDAENDALGETSAAAELTLILIITGLVLVVAVAAIIVIKKKPDLKMAIGGALSSNKKPSRGKPKSPRDGPGKPVATEQALKGNTNTAGRETELAKVDDGAKMANLDNGAPLDTDLTKKGGKK